MGRDWEPGSIHVSIHAPAWGATRSVWCPLSRGLAVSIHAPAWGATMSCCMMDRCLASFQSTRPRGARHAHRLIQLRALRRFNPRARVGRDLHVVVFVAGLSRFNPRARVGRDHVERLALIRRVLVSIHAPAWGATDAGARVNQNRVRVSIHAPAWGATPPHHNSLRDKDFFQGIREPMLPFDPKGTGQVAATQKTNEINKLLKCEPSRESRTA